jgi:transposase
MSMKNKHVIRFHIPEKKFREIIYLFSEDLSATQISHLTKISKPSINKYLAAIRFRVFEYCQDQSPLKGEIEVDESYFGARGKIIVFGLLKRQGKVYTEIIYDCSAAVLQKFIREKVVTLAV